VEAGGRGHGSVELEAGLGEERFELLERPLVPPARTSMVKSIIVVRKAIATAMQRDGVDLMSDNQVQAWMEAFNRRSEAERRRFLG
jgi:hypothetical protein